MTKNKKGVDTSLMVGGKSVPVNAGVAEPPTEKRTHKEILEDLDDIENRLDALEEAAFGDAKKQLEEMVKGVTGNFNERLKALEKAAGEETKK